MKRRAQTRAFYNLHGDKNGQGKIEYRVPIDGRELVVVSDEVKEPVKLRYLFSRPWFGALYNDACLTLAAFEIAK